jgi:hypothetical protein
MIRPIAYAFTAEAIIPKPTTNAVNAPSGESDFFRKPWMLKNNANANGTSSEWTNMCAVTIVADKRGTGLPACI